MNQATQAVEAALLEPQFIGTVNENSWVKSQSPAGGTTVYQGSIVEMHVVDIRQP